MEARRQTASGAFTDIYAMVCYVSFHSTKDGDKKEETGNGGGRTRGKELERGAMQQQNDSETLHRKADGLRHLSIQTWSIKRYREGSMQQDIVSEDCMCCQEDDDTLGHSTT